jgi:murein DD-endopeptidase MepM/ murein hydrolase activator NlpD
MANRLADILQQEYKTKGLIGGTASALSKSSREKMDVRNILFGGSGLGSIIGRKVFGKGYSAIDRSSKVSNVSEALSSGSSSILQEISINGKITAKNSMSLPRLAEQMNIMQKNVAKLVRLQGETPSTKANNFFSDSKFRENAYEATFNKNARGTTPTKVEPNKQGSLLGSLSGILGIVGNVFSSILKPLSFFGGVLGKAALAALIFGRTISRIFGFLFKTKIGKLLGLAGLAVGANEVFGGDDFNIDGDNDNQSMGNGNIENTIVGGAAVAGGALAAAGAGYGIYQGSKALSGTKNAILDARTISAGQLKNMQPKSIWGKFLQYMATNNKVLYRAVGVRLAQMAALMGIPIAGWLSALISIGLSIPLAYEVWQMWQKFKKEGMPDTEGESSTSPEMIDNSDSESNIKQVSSPTQVASAAPSDGSTGKGRISGRFGEDRGTHSHAGVDITGNIGDPVYATGDGKVVRADENDPDGYGKQIEILHPDGTKTKYAHLNAFKVATGEQVKSGQQIAELGNTGRSTGPHLHYEKITKDGKVQPSDAEVKLALNPSGTATPSTQLAKLQNNLRNAMSGLRINSFSQEKELAKVGNQQPTQVAIDNSTTNQTSGSQGSFAGQPTVYDEFFANKLVGRTYT